MKWRPSEGKHEEYNPQTENVGCLGFTGERLGIMKFGGHVDLSTHFVVDKLGFGLSEAEITEL